MESADHWVASLAGKGLSAREIDVARALVSGLSEKQIAKELGLSIHTIHGSVKKIYRVQNVHSRAELLVQIFSNEQNRS